VSIKALGHHVLVKVEKPAEKKGSIVIPEMVRDAERRGSEFGVVLDVGPTAWLADGLGGEPWAKVGDKVWFARYGGKWVAEPDSEEQFLLLLDTDILGRLEV